MKTQKIPFEFVLEILDKASPEVRPMFGCQAVYIGEKIVFILRRKSDERRDNGVWVATSHEHHASLKEQFPSLRRIEIFGDKESAWQNLPESARDFEESVTSLCALVLKNDSRIGRIPKKKKKKEKR